MKNSKIININVKTKTLFKRWLSIIKSFHNLTPVQQDILALLLYYHYELSKEITNTKILWKMVFDYDTKMKIKEELNMKDYNLQNHLSALRSKGVIKDNKIINAYIPNIDAYAKSFKIVFNLKIIDDEQN